MTLETSSCSETRTMATRSNSPATEYTSVTPSCSAMACAASGISSISHCTRTSAWTIRSGPLEDDGHAHAAGDAQGGETEAEASRSQLVGRGQHDAGAGHADGVTERDRSTV